MVVIKECFPSRMEFIADYLTKKRYQIEIQQQRKFNLSFIPREEERINPTLVEDLDQSEQISQSGDAINTKTPVIISAHHEPKYVKNFNAFIEKTHQHLNKVLATNQKISDVHGIVTEIQKPEFNKHFVFDELSSPPADDKFTNAESKLPTQDCEVDDKNATVQSTIATRRVKGSCEGLSEKKPTKLSSNLNSTSASHLETQKKDNSSFFQSAYGTEIVPRQRICCTVPTVNRPKTTRLNAPKIGLKPNASLSVRSEGAKSGLPRKFYEVASETCREPNMRKEDPKRKRTLNVMTSNKSITSRTLVGPNFYVDNQGSISRRTGTSTSRSEYSASKSKKMAPVPVSVINLQL